MRQAAVHSCVIISNIICACVSCYCNQISARGVKKLVSEGGKSGVQALEV